MKIYIKIKIPTFDMLTTDERTSLTRLYLNGLNYRHTHTHTHSEHY